MPKTTMYEANPNHRRKTRGEPYYQTLSSWFPKDQFVPTWDTDPWAIRERQKEDCEEAKNRIGPGATPEQISEEVLLPVSIVRRALGMATTPPVKPKPPGGRSGAIDRILGSGRQKRKDRMAARVAAVTEVLRGRPDGLFTHELAAKVGLSRARLSLLLNGTPGFRWTRGPNDARGYIPPKRWFLSPQQG